MKKKKLQPLDAKQLATVVGGNPEPAPWIVVTSPQPSPWSPEPAPWRVSS
jgi:hypothetical protein